MIQPHGFLIGVTPDWNVAHVSANIGGYLVGGSAPQPGDALADVLGDEAVHTLRNRLSLLRDPGGVARVFALAATGTAGPIDVQMHMVGEDVLVEAQPADGKDSGDPIGLVRALAARLDARDGLEDMLNEGARQLRALTGFDNVTLFRWTEDGAAVVAHSARGTLTPAPTPECGALRQIVDTHAQGVAIERQDPPGSLDRCLLLAPRPEEDIGLGPSASMLRLPLTGGGSEWGVAVCLNASPRKLGLFRLASAELFTDLLTLRIALHEARA